MTPLASTHTLVLTLKSSSLFCHSALKAPSPQPPTSPPELNLLVSHELLWVRAGSVRREGFVWWAWVTGTLTPPGNPCQASLWSQWTPQVVLSWSANDSTVLPYVWRVSEDSSIGRVQGELQRAPLPACTIKICVIHICVQNLGLFRVRKSKHY